MSLLPETAEYIAELSAAEEYRQCRSLIRAINHEFEQNCLVDLAEHSRRLAEIQERVRAVGIRNTAEKTKKEHTKSIKCPFKAGLQDECRGYILVGSSCGLCKTRLCKECNVAQSPSKHNETLVYPDHACDPSDVLSWQAIKEDSVGCPKCGTRIQKISGCNQMWCTVKDCNTAFDWATGKVVNGPVHNPHYHQWLANGGGAGLEPEAIDIACAGPRGVITNQRIRRIYTIMSPVIEFSRTRTRGSAAMNVVSTEPVVYFNGRLETKTEASETFLAATQYMRCIAEAVDLQHNIEPYGRETHRDLRIQFLQNSITKKEWASKMSHRETLRTKQLKCRDLHLMFQTACADIFARLYTECEKYALDKNEARKMTEIIKSLNIFIEGAEGLRLYYNDQLKRILSDYSDKSAKLLEFSRPGRVDTLSWYTLRLNEASQ
jgi:hypothetical protein